MKIKNPVFSVSLRYSALASLLSIVLFSVLYYFGRNPLLLPSFLDYRLLLFPIFLVFGIREFKETRNNGVLHFWQGFSIGMLIILVIGMVMFAYIFVLGGLIDHNFTANYIMETVHNITSAQDKIIAQYGEKVYNESLKLVPTTSLFDLALDYFIKSLPLGIILTILISLVLRFKPK